MSSAVRADALRSEPDGFTLRIGLPWMRSLPLSCILALELRLGGETVPQETLEVVLGPRRVPLGRLGATGDVWWFLQDRLVVRGTRGVLPGESHDVVVSGRMMLPYLSAGEGPAVLPFSVAGHVTVDAAAPRGGVSHDVA